MAAAKTRDQSDLGSASPRADAYTGMLVVSLLATLTGIAFLYMDYSQYPDQKPVVQKYVPAGGGAAPAPAPVPPRQPAPGAQPAPAPAKPGP
jgi:hypothetical protein